MRIYSTRWVVAGVAVVGLLAAYTARAMQQDPGPFSPEVKEFVVKDPQRLQLMLNVFNLTGAGTVTDVVETTHRAFRQPSTNITGTVLRFGARYTF